MFCSLSALGFARTYTVKMFVILSLVALARQAISTGDSLIQLGLDAVKVC
jgi:aryl carrier-like protein